MNKQQKMGVILIVIGALLLLNQFQWVRLSGKNMIALFSVLLGMLMIKKAFSRPERKGLLGGSFFVIWGVLLFAFSYNAYPLGRTLFLGNLFLSIGFANLIYFIFSGNSKSINLFVFALFAGLGGSMVAAFYGKLNVWKLEEILATYWPVVLILFGAFILVDSYRNKRGVPKDDFEISDNPENDPSGH